MPPIPRPSRIPGGERAFQSLLKKKHAEIRPQTADGQHYHLFGHAQDYFRDKLGFPEKFKTLQLQELRCDRAARQILYGQSVRATVLKQLIQTALKQHPKCLVAYQALAGKKMPAAEVDKFDRMAHAFRTILPTLDHVESVKINFAHIERAMILNGFLQIEMIGDEKAKEYAELMAWAGEEIVKVAET